MSWVSCKASSRIMHCKCPYSTLRRFSTKYVQKKIHLLLFNAFKVECPFKPDGCGARPPRSELEKHKELCGYRPEKLAEQKKAKQAELSELRRRVRECVYDVY